MRSALRKAATRRTVHIGLVKPFHSGHTACWWSFRRLRQSRLILCIRNEFTFGALSQVRSNVRSRRGSKLTSPKLFDRISYRPCGTDVDRNIGSLEHSQRPRADGTGYYRIHTHVPYRLGNLMRRVLRPATVL